MQIKIGDKIIARNNPCFIIAEAGVNHNGNLALAKKLIAAAKASGVDAVKFQTYKTEEIVTPSAEQADYQKKNIGRNETQYDMLKRLELPSAAFRELKNYADKAGIIFLSTPHSGKQDFDLVAELCPAIKIGSGDLTNLPALKYAANLQLPIILATGMSTLSEVEEAVNIILPLNQKLILLHCTTNYPAAYGEVNLLAMKTMAKKFGLTVGYSDHTEGINISLAAVALGALVIEKHFTLDRNLPGPDHKASLEPSDLKKLVIGIREIENRMLRRENTEKIMAELNIAESLGDGIKKPTSSEIETAKVARKSIIAKINIPKDSIITEDMLAIRRPGTGLASRELPNILGKTANKNILINSLLSFDDIK